MPGPIPKDPKLRQRENRVSTAATLVDTSPLNVGVPPLPTRGRRKWRQEVIDWWADVWASPMASEYVQADLHGLYLLADLLDTYWRVPTVALATEIRLQRQCFGLTPIDRRRLQWEVHRTEEAERKRRPTERRTAANPHDDPRDVLRVVS